MIWLFAALPAVSVAVVMLACGSIYPALAIYHALCAGAVISRAKELRGLFTWDRKIALWTLATTALTVGVLFAIVAAADLDALRPAVREWGFPAKGAFVLFSIYTLAIHVPLEELYWRGIVLGKGGLHEGLLNALFFYLLHALPLGVMLGPSALVLALPTAAAAGAWSFARVRTASIAPSLVSHGAACAALLVTMGRHFGA